MHKKIIKSVSLVLVLIVLVLSGLYIIPPDQETIEYEYADIESNPLINAKVGWYTADNNRNYQVTWGAKKGLQLNFFDFSRDKLKSLRLTHIKDNEFDTANNLETTEVRFSTHQVDSVLSLEVSTSKTKFRATRQDSLYYNQQEVQFFNGDHRIAGLLLSPFGDDKSTAIVFIHGSGVSDRDNFWYLHQAHFLAKSGFTVLLPDKRGCGKSSGEWHTASFDDFADDISAALDYLREKGKSEFSKMGVIGISQGGWISHLVNQKDEDLDFVVDVVGSSTTPKTQLQYEIFNDIKGSGAPSFIAKPLSVVFAKRARAKRKIWWDKNGAFDPIPLMSNSSIPILKIFGSEDENVPLEKSMERINQLMEKYPESLIEIKTFDGTSHALFDKETNWIRKDYLEFISTWISRI
ncbi:MAG: alpha/beta fold hydrolase [Ekhidna sp.]|nr:alpha/beta fold hydrolase [Ekhidna sp.]